MAQQGRSIFPAIFKNILKSLRPKNFQKGNHIGTDYMGTKYFEVPADPQGGKRRPARSFEPLAPNKFDQDIPAEWEAWLRGRRKDPPTEEEVIKNQAMILLKERNAEKISLQFPSKGDDCFQKKKGMESYPSYSEYEQVPGMKEDSKSEK